MVVCKRLLGWSLCAEKERELHTRRLVMLLRLRFRLDYWLVTISSFAVEQLSK